MRLTAALIGDVLLQPIASTRRWPRPASRPPPRGAARSAGAPLCRQDCPSIRRIATTSLAGRWAAAQAAGSRCPREAISVTRNRALFGVVGVVLVLVNEADRRGQSDSLGMARTGRRDPWRSGSAWSGDGAYADACADRPCSGFACALGLRRWAHEGMRACCDVRRWWTSRASLPLGETRAGNGVCPAKDEGQGDCQSQLSLDAESAQPVSHQPNQAQKALSTKIRTTRQRSQALLGRR